MKSRNSFGRNLKLPVEDLCWIRDESVSSFLVAYFSIAFVKALKIQSLNSTVSTSETAEFPHFCPRYISIKLNFFPPPWFFFGKRRGRKRSKHIKISNEFFSLSPLFSYRGKVFHIFPRCAAKKERSSWERVEGETIRKKNTSSKSSEECAFNKIQLSPSLRDDKQAHTRALPDRIFLFYFPLCRRMWDNFSLFFCIAFLLSNKHDVFWGANRHIIQHFLQDRTGSFW